VELAKITELLERQNVAMAAAAQSGGGAYGGGQRSGGFPQRIPLPRGPLKNADKIITEGKIPELAGVTLRPLWNTHRSDGMRGVEGRDVHSSCEICDVFDKEAKHDISRYDFIGRWGPPSQTNQQREYCIVHFRPYCRGLKIMACRHVQRHPEDKSYLEEDTMDNARAVIMQSKVEQVGSS
jgi:hypothetical protein